MFLKVVDRTTDFHKIHVESSQNTLLFWQIELFWKVEVLTFGIISRIVQLLDTIDLNQLNPYGAIYTGSRLLRVRLLRAPGYNK